MNILITGIAGFIGHHLATRLIEEGHTIVGIDNLNDYYDVTLKEARLKRLKGKFSFHKIDTTDFPALEELFKKHKFDKICHLAAQAGVRYSLENPFVYATSNYVGTLNIFELAKRHGVKDIAFASSSSVYGGNEELPFAEHHPVNHPLSMYAASKRAGELLAHSYCHLFGLNIICLRFFTVYGPWGRPDMALFLFTKSILEEKPIEVFNGGDMRRDFTYVSDIVDGIVKTIHKQPRGFSILNLGAGNPINLPDFIGIIEKTLDKKANIVMKPMQAGDVQATWADISKARELIGYKPKVSIEEGITNFVKWFREYYGV